jgi:hypothetical protein
MGTLQGERLQHFDTQGREFFLPGEKHGAFHVQLEERIAESFDEFPASPHKGNGGRPGHIPKAPLGGYPPNPKE